MKNNNLENNIKDSFEHYLPDLDHDEIWDNIEPHLKKKKKRRFFFIWFLGGIAILGMFLSNKYYWSDTPVAEQHISETVSNINTASEKTVDPISTTSTIETKIESTINKEQKSEVKKQNVNTDASTFLNKKSISNPNKQSQISLEFNQESIVSKTDIPVTIDLIPENDISKEEVIEIIEEVETPVFEEVIEEVIAEAEPILEEAPKAVDPFEESLTKKEEEKEKEKDEKKKKKITKPLKNKFRFIIQPTVSAIVPIKSLKQRTGFGENTYLQHRKDTEKQLEAFSIGLNFIAQNRKGFVLMSGIEIQRLNGRYKFEEKTEEQEVNQGVISITENALGETIATTTGPILTTRRTEKIQRFYNHHTFVNIPIGIGKYWHKPKYDIRFITGLDFNIYHNFKGLIRGPYWDLDMRYKDNSAFDETFKRKTGMGFWVTTEFHRTVNKKFSWSLAPKLQLPFSKITKDDYVIEQRFMKFSLTLGANFLIAPDKKN